MSATLIGQPPKRTVPVASLEAELPRLWTDLCRRVEDDHGHLPLHTNILSLVVVAQGRTEERLARETLDHLAEVQPSRAVLVLVDRAATELTADITAHCQRSDDGQVRCYELIELRVPPDRLIAVPSLLVPLELFDVPTFVWLVGQVNFDAPEMTMIAKFSQRVIVDTARFDDAISSLPDYESFLERSGRGCTGSDLNWARSTSWRELVAQSFDNPMARKLLRGIQNVEIDFDPSAEAQGLLLAGWLGSRLSWTPTRAERRGASLVAGAHSPAGGNVTLALNRQASGGVGLRAVRILASGPSGTARTTIRRRDERLAAVAFETAGIRQERVLPDARPTVQELVSTELMMHSRDLVYEQALGCATQWLQLIEGAA